MWLLVSLFACDIPPSGPAVPGELSPDGPDPAEAPPPDPTLEVPPGPTVRARLSGTAEHPDLQGVVTLTPSGDRVDVSFELSGLPEGPHGSHVHVSGDCSDPTNDSMGGHLDFATVPGGAVLPEEGGEASPAVNGNLGEVTGDDDGVASVRRQVPELAPGQLSALAGRAVVVHERGNDPSDPSGDAGTPIACGVIGRTGAPGAETPEGP